MFKPEYEKTLAGADDAVSSVLNTSSDFPEPGDDVPIINDDTVEEDAPWALTDLTFKYSRGPPSMRRLQERFRTHGLSVPSYGRSTQEVIKAALAALVLTAHDDISLAKLKDAYAADKAELK